MKRLFLLSCLLWAAFSCTKEPLESTGKDKGGAVIAGSPVGAVQGTLAVRLTASAADAVSAAQEKTRGASFATRSGLEITDEILDRIGAERFVRIIPYDEEFEEQHRASGLHLWYRIYFDDAVSLEEAGELLRADTCISVIEYTCEYNPIKPRPVPQTHRIGISTKDTRALLPMNDPLLLYQWHYNNRGGSYIDGVKFTKMATGADINLFDAWTLCTGDPRVVVAVIDEPIQATHPDLVANIWENTIDPERKGLHGYNFYGNTAALDWQSSEYNAETNTYDYADHGTHVAGTIAAMNGNGIGVSGIAGGKNGKGGVKLMSCQIMGYGDVAKNYDTNFQALVYAADHGAVIAQNSWGYGTISEGEWSSATYESTRTGINYFINNAGAKNSRFPDAPLKGGIVIFAAGNYGDTMKDIKIWPSAYSSVIAVGAMDWGFRPAYYTNYGSWVDITAPGGDADEGTANDGNNYGWNSSVISTVLQDPKMTFLDGRTASDTFGYDAMQGTSMACPHVSGVAALGLSYAAQLGKQYTVEEFKAMLLASVYGIDDYFNGTKKSQDELGKVLVLNMPDYKHKMGGGCVDALKLLLAIKGTPALYVKTGEATTLDLARYFGGSASMINLKSAKLSSASALGLSSSLVPIDGMKITLNCPHSGVSMISIRAQAGDTEFEREFAIVSRASLANNGGWL